MKFTKKNIDNLEPRGTKGYFVSDDALENFGIFVYPSGKKKFGVKVRFGTSKKQKTIKQDWGDISIQDARDIGREYIKQYKSGIDVSTAEKQNHAKNKTFRSCIDEYKKTVKKQTSIDIERCKGTKNGKKTSWDKWLDKPIRDITPSMVLKGYDLRVKESRHRARLEAAYLRSIWNYFKKQLNLDNSPTLILNEERKGWSSRTIRRRRLDHETASNWYKAIEKLSERDKNLFKLVYFTGLRAGEAMGLEWSHINFDNESLHIPDTKNGKPLDIPLNSYAMDVLRSIKDGQYKHKKYVFPQVGRDKKVSAMTTYSKSLTVLKNEGVLWSPHDSRRGFINAGGVTGCNTYMIKQLVNHADNGAEAHAGYNYYTIAELRTTAQTIGDHLNNQLTSTNIVEVNFKKTKNY